MIPPRKKHLERPAPPPGEPSPRPTYPVNLSIAEECLGTYQWLRSAWGGDFEAEAMRRAMEHALEGWEPPASRSPAPQEGVAEVVAAARTYGAAYLASIDGPACDRGPERMDAMRARTLLLNALARLPAPPPSGEGDWQP